MAAQVSATATLSSHSERILSTSAVWSDRYHEVILPWCSQVATRLELPAWDLYRDAWAVCTSDFLKASSSFYHLSYLTLKPVAILLWILLGHVWKFVLEHGGKSLHTGAIHLRLACIHFYRFQTSLNKTQLLGEAALMLLCVGLYYLRRWLLRQTYWAKFVKWYKAKKKRLAKYYTTKVHQIANVSKLLAMALPHLVVLTVGIGLMAAFPGTIRWITYETPTIVVLSLYYPFLSTLVWVHSQKHDWGDTQTNNTNNNSNYRQGNNKTITTTPSKQTESTKVLDPKKKFQAKARAKAKLADHNKTSSFITETAALETSRYWLHYWQLYAVVQALGSCLSMVPIVGRFLISHPIVSFVTGECKLLFFVWVFGMEKLLGKTAKDAFLAEALPMKLIQKLIRPLILQLHSVVSDAVSKQFWQKWVVSKTKTVLDIAVMVRAISEQRRDWLVHMVEEARVLTLPSITLLMPGFVTQFGVAYVQYLVPSAKSAEASSKTTKLVYLQYWILHCLTAGLLHKLHGILWWVPFSSHLIFLLWSYLILPQTITSWYGILESELMAFGILPKGKQSNSSATNMEERAIRISDTKTAWLFYSLVERLPSANANADEAKPTADESDSKESPTPIALENEQPDSETTTTEVEKPQKEVIAKASAGEPTATPISPSPSTTEAETSPDVIPMEDDDDQVVSKQIDQE